MNSQREEFQRLLDRLKSGDVMAAEELVKKYGPHVVKAIQRRARSNKMRILYSTEDCMQSVWGSIFADRDKMADIQSPEHMVRYLARVAFNKLIDQDRHLRAHKNDVYRECPLPGEDTQDRFGLVDQDLSPSHKVAIEDEWEHQTRGLSSAKKTILDLHRKGHTSEEIAAHTEYSGRGIRRIIQQFTEMFRR
jgi:DNA-directed RNA polymerase specialized sigma24 family protein